MHDLWDHRGSYMDYKVSISVNSRCMVISSINWLSFHKHAPFFSFQDYSMDVVDGPVASHKRYRDFQNFNTLCINLTANFRDLEMKMRRIRP